MALCHKLRQFHGIPGHTAYKQAAVSKAVELGCTLPAMSVSARGMTRARLRDAFPASGLRPRDKVQRNRALAFVMGGHHRLGKNSVLNRYNQFDKDLQRMVVEYSLQLDFDERSIESNDTKGSFVIYETFVCPNDHGCFGEVGWDVMEGKFVLRVFSLVRDPPAMLLKTGLVFSKDGRHRDFDTHSKILSLESPVPLIVVFWGRTAEHVSVYKVPTVSGRKEMDPLAPLQASLLPALEFELDPRFLLQNKAASTSGYNKLYVSMPRGEQTPVEEIHSLTFHEQEDGTLNHDIDFVALRPRFGVNAVLPPSLLPIYTSKSISHMAASEHCLLITQPRDNNTRDIELWAIGLEEDAAWTLVAVIHSAFDITRTWMVNYSIRCTKDFRHTAAGHGHLYFCPTFKSEMKLERMLLLEVSVPNDEPRLTDLKVSEISFDNTFNNEYKSISAVADNNVIILRAKNGDMSIIDLHKRLSLLESKPEHRQGARWTSFHKLGNDIAEYLNYYSDSSSENDNVAEPMADDDDDNVAEPLADDDDDSSSENDNVADDDDSSSEEERGYG